MNKYLLLVLILAASLFADLGTKTMAEANLASRTRQYEHYLHFDVEEEAAGQTLSEYLEARFSRNSSDEVTEIATQSTFIVNDDGDLLRRGHPLLELSASDRIEVQHRRIVIIEGFLDFRYVENRGAAWGFLSGASNSFRIPFFIGVGSIAVLALLLWFRTIEDDKRFLIWSLGLIAGGAIGNIVDRVRYGYVVDFIHCRPGFDWPTFNIADALIVAGVGMMFMEAVREHFRVKAQEREAAAKS